MLHSLALWVAFPQYLQEGRMGATECIVLAFEEECDDLVNATSEG
jgi:hypothetical protein